MGLVEEEWLCTLATINVNEVTFVDFIEKGKELATELKNQVSPNCHVFSLGFGLHCFIHSAFY